jgi:hypothetical protein
LVLAPDRDEPALGADGNRNNDFSYADDMQGFEIGTERCSGNYHLMERQFPAE